MVDLSQRRQNYRAIEEYRRRPLIVYATSTRPNVPAAMAGDAVREFIDQIDAVPKDGRKVDVLLHSTGGDALTAWKLMSILTRAVRRGRCAGSFHGVQRRDSFCSGCR